MNRWFWATVVYWGYIFIAFKLATMGKDWPTRSGLLIFSSIGLWCFFIGPVICISIGVGG